MSSSATQHPGDQQTGVPARRSPLHWLPVNLGSAADVGALVTLVTQNWLGGCILGFVGALLGMVHVVQSRGRTVTRALIVAVVGAVLGGAVFGFSLDRLIAPPNTGRTGQAATTAGPPQTSDPALTPVTESSPPTGTSGIMRYTGDVLLSSYVDLDQQPPKQVNSAERRGENDITILGGQEVWINSPASVAHWERGEVPSAKECADVLDRLNLGSNYTFDTFGKGRSFCLRTTEERVAFVRVKEGNRDGYLLSVTVWEK